MDIIIAVVCSPIRKIQVLEIMTGNANNYLQYQTASTIYLDQDILASSPTQPVELQNLQGTFAAYNGHILMGDLTTGTFLRIFLEQVNNVWQGVCFRHSGGTASGDGSGGFYGSPNRLVLGPDGSYYIGEIGAGRSWQYYDGFDNGLQRLVPKFEASLPEHFNEMLAVRAITGGLEIEFLKPLPESVINNTGNYSIKRWTYVPTYDYGGQKLAQTELSVTSATTVNSGKKVRLSIGNLKDADDTQNFTITGVKDDDYGNRGNVTGHNKNVGWIVHCIFDPVYDHDNDASTPNTKGLWTGEFWYTMLKKL